MREIIIRWLETAQNLAIGAKLHLPTSSRKEQEVIFLAIHKEMNVLRKIDPEKAASLVPFKIFKDGRFWVGVEKILAIPTLGFIKNPDGSVEKVKLSSIDPERERRLRLMREDGLSLDDIEKMEGPLSMDELIILKEM